MSIVAAIAIIASCLVTAADGKRCINDSFRQRGGEAIAGWQEVNEQTAIGPVFSGQSLDVVLSAGSALVWDEKSGMVLYEKKAAERRPVASLVKLLSALVVRDELTMEMMLEVPPEVRKVQLRGANVSLAIGEHVSVYDLLAAGLIASANDAFVTLAVSGFGGEEEFVDRANEFAGRNGLYDTKIGNSTGLSGGEQYSTARDIMKMFRLVYRNQEIRNLLVSKKGVLRTKEGTVKRYKSTNELLGTYFPVLAAKTGYTPDAGENLVIMTYGREGQRIGAVVLGSDWRFQDTKALVEWVWRNYSWP